MRAILLALLLCSPCVGQTIGGLSTLPVLAEGRYPVSGLEVPQGSIDELSKWAQKLVVEASGPDGAEMAIEVDIGLVKRAPTIYFASDKPGLHVLCIIDTGSKTPKIATKRVQVGEVVTPAPNPPGPGPNSPTPNQPAKKIRQAVLVYEKSRHAIKSEVRAELTAIATGGEIACFFVDQDAVDGTGQLPDSLARVVPAAVREGLPGLAVEYTDGSVVVHKDLSSAAAVRKAVSQ